VVQPADKSVVLATYFSVSLPSELRCRPVVGVPRLVAVTEDFPKPVTLQAPALAGQSSDLVPSIRARTYNICKIWVQFYLSNYAKRKVTQQF